MTFHDAVDKEEYDRFVSSHPQKAHFMQSAAWGEFNMTERGLTPHYVGLRDDSGALVAAALLLERKPLLLPPYLYSPRGFVIDFFDRELLNRFCEEITAFCRSKKVMFLKIDPDIELHTITDDGTYTGGNGVDNSFLIEELKQLGFIHLGFNNEFERRQPRFTFRIDLQRDKIDILDSIRGNVLKNVKKGEKNYDTGIYIGDSSDVDNLYRLIGETSIRDDFYAYSLRYYRNFYEILNRYGMVKLYMGKTYIQGTIEKLMIQLAEVQKLQDSYTKPSRIAEAEITKQRICDEIEKFNTYYDRYGAEAVTNAHLVVRYAGKSWAVHAGSSNDMGETFLNNRIYLYKILDQKDCGAEFLDQFGTVGAWKESPHRTLHEFKRQFGGRYIEFIGEFDLVIRRFWYGIYTKLLPRYRNLSFDIRAFIRRITGRA